MGRACVVVGFGRALRSRRCRSGACFCLLHHLAMWRGRTGGCAGVTSGFQATDQTHGKRSRRRTGGLSLASGLRSRAWVAVGGPVARLRASPNSAASAPRTQSSGRGTPMTGERWRPRGSVATSGTLQPAERSDVRRHSRSRLQGPHVWRQRPGGQSCFSFGLTAAMRTSDPRQSGGRSGRAGAA
jgi:hypothetical protein